MVRRVGPHGPFYGCSNFPGCRGTRDLEEQPPLAIPVLLIPQEQASRSGPPARAQADSRSAEAWPPFWKYVVAPLIVTVLSGLLLSRLVGGGGQTDQPRPPREVEQGQTPATHREGKGEEVKVCPKCGGRMQVKVGKFGEFYSCVRYPDCKGTLNYP
jgi:ssDNA-binding Zn-finger/Zn-ribbon topoisomerase 1